MSEPVMNLRHFREILQYVPSYRNSTFVISVDGEISSDADLISLVEEVAVLRNLGIHVVLVHGISGRLREYSKQRGISISSATPEGVTDDETMALVRQASSEVTHLILGAFRRLSLPAATPNAMIARPAGIIEGVDLQHSGTILRCDSGVLSDLLGQNVTPVLPPLAYDHEGRTLRVSSDSLAIQASIAVAARKLLLLSSLEGITSQGRLVRQMDIEQAERLLKDTSAELPSTMRTKLRRAAAGCRKGVERVHIINGRNSDAILAELFSNEGVGTLIYSDRYQVIRSADRSDISSIETLLSEAATDDEIIRRSREDLENTIDDFFVAEIDGNPVACAALHTYNGAPRAELACLVVAQGHRDYGLAARLIAHIEKVAAERGIEAIFCLTTQAASFFKRVAAFEEAGRDILPEERRFRWEQNGRNSKILTKRIATNANASR